MHEQGAVAKAVARTLQRAGRDPIGTVRVAIGPRADRDVVALAWSQLVADTALANTRVYFIEASDRMSCFGCGKDYDGSALVTCPDCGSFGLPIDEAADVSVEVVR